jgi:hypothetical protein
MFDVCALQSSQSIAIMASVQGNTQELITLAAAVNRVEEGVKRTITVSTTDSLSNLPEFIGLGSLLTPPAIWGGNTQLQRSCHLFRIA